MKPKPVLILFFLLMGVYFYGLGLLSIADRFTFLGFLDSRVGSSLACIWSLSWKRACNKHLNLCCIARFSLWPTMGDCGINRFVICTRHIVSIGTFSVVGRRHSYGTKGLTLVQTYGQKFYLDVSITPAYANGLKQGGHNFPIFEGVSKGCPRNLCSHCRC